MSAAENNTPLRASLLTEVHLISDTYKKVRAEQVFAVDYLEYDLFAAGWKACAALVAERSKP